MKKSIATIVLFTLVVVTTSFTTVENFQNLPAIKSTTQSPPIIGAVCARCGGKKVDVVQSETTVAASNAAAGQTNSFSTDKQALGNTKKTD